ncbi:MAG: glycosyltransferase [Rubrivivax sp.]|nr:glycosyltransferase [Rubrivivax sp.]
MLQVSKFYPPVHGGIEAVARDLARGFVRHGLATEVLCAHDRPRTVHEVDDAGVPVTRAASLGLVLSTSMSPALAWLLRRRRRRDDIVHVHMPDPMAALAVWVARPSGRVVLHWHSDVVRQRVSRALYAPLERWLLRRADAVVATSPPYAETSATLAPWRDKVACVPIGVPAPRPADPAAVAALRRRYAGRRIVFALGRMTYYKGWDVLVDAAARLPDDVVVLVGGGGEGLSACRARAAQAKKGARIEFLGPLADDEVEACFAAADLFAMASTVRAEAYGVAVLEAMARGLAVVATDIPGSGLGWLHQHGVTGLKVPVRDPAALASAIATLLADDALRARCGAAGRARWASGFTAETMADEMVALYRRLLRPRAGGGAGGETTGTT